MPLLLNLQQKRLLDGARDANGTAKTKIVVSRLSLALQPQLQRLCGMRPTQQQPIESGGELKHLLWSLVFLKVCATTHIHCSIVGWPSTKTCAKWSWHFIKRIADLKEEVISLENGFNGLGQVVNTNCFISADETDCPTFEPWPFSKKMFSHKLNGPAVKCKVAICIKTGGTV